MAIEPTKTTAPTPPTPPKTTTGAIRVDLYNPTRARRIIHDGIDGSHKAIVIEVGEVKRNVEIHEGIAKELRARTKKRGTENSDLHVFEAGKAPDPSAAPEDEDDDVG